MRAPSPPNRAGRIRPRSWPRPAIRSSMRCSGTRWRSAIDPDVPVRLDPRLTATALAHLLENAAQYTPAGSDDRRRRARGRDEALVIQVRDQARASRRRTCRICSSGSIRGAAAKARASGTGMGLWIVRGLLAAEQGRVWAENCADGGAQFTIVVPVAVKDSGTRRFHRIMTPSSPDSARRRRGRDPARGRAAAALARIRRGDRRHRA